MNDWKPPPVLSLADLFGALTSPRRPEVSFTISGPDSCEVIGIMALACEFAAGPGLEQFAAYCDQQAPEEGCECGSPAIHRENIGRHTAEMARKLNGMLENVGYNP